LLADAKAESPGKAGLIPLLLRSLFKATRIVSNEEKQTIGTRKKRVSASLT